MKKVGVIIPTLGRPHALEKLVNNIYDKTDKNDIDIIFVVEQSDHDSISALKGMREITIFNQRTKSFSGAVNTAVRTFPHDYFYIGNDDFLFHDNWLPPLLEMSEYFAVVGPDDLGNPAVKAGVHATSFLVARRYLHRACIGNPQDLLFEGYIHNYCDTEFSQTAMANQEYAFCPMSVVEHIHPAFNKAAMDDTYAITSNPHNYYLDEQTFNSRRHLWEGRSFVS